VGARFDDYVHAQCDKMIVFYRDRKKAGDCKNYNEQGGVVVIIL
jgi:hypothetical protein